MRVFLRRSNLILLVGMSLSSTGCGTPWAYLKEHPDEGLRAAYDIPATTLPDVLRTVEVKSYSGSIAYPILDSATLILRKGYTNSFVVNFNPQPDPWYPAACVVDVIAYGTDSEQSGVKVLCDVGHYDGALGYLGSVPESRDPVERLVLAAISKEVAKFRLANKSTGQDSSVVKQTEKK